MNDEKKYNAEQIKRYLEGKLSPSEMHALEKAALDDPFLADALEGIDLHIAAHGQAKFNADHEELKQRLSGRIRMERQTAFLWWKVAAVLFVIASGIAIILYTGEKNQEKSTELARTENKGDSVLQSTTPSQSERASVQEILHDSNQKPVETKKSKARVKSDTGNERDRSVFVPQTDQSEEVYTAPAARADSAQVSSGNEAPARSLEGKAASVNITRNKEMNQRKMNEQDSNAPTEEEVVMAYDASKKESDPSTSKPLSEQKTRRRIEPDGGWDAFEKYIDENHHLTASDTILKGTEKVTFSINDAGRPNAIKVLQSVSPTHDAEVIRLLTEGPSWKILRGSRRSVTISIVF